MYKKYQIEHYFIKLIMFFIICSINIFAQTDSNITDSGSSIDSIDVQTDLIDQSIDQQQEPNANNRMLLDNTILEETQNIDEIANLANIENYIKQAQVCLDNNVLDNIFVDEIYDCVSECNIAQGACVSFLFNKNNKNCILRKSLIGNCSVDLSEQGFDGWYQFDNQNNIDTNVDTNVDSDNDGDGLLDSQEIELNTDPNNPDTDGDNLLDGDEVNQFGTDPLNPDTDNGGVIDGEEIQKGLDPLNSNDDQNILDNDQDGITIANGDCNDNDASIFLGATEICGDNIDNNCDNQVDEAEVCDSDNDGIDSSIDNCPNLANPDQSDSDSDSIGDACDNCPNNVNTDQKDYDGNGVGDICEVYTSAYQQMEHVCYAVDSSYTDEITNEASQEICEERCNNDVKCEAYVYRTSDGFCTLRRNLCDCPDIKPNGTEDFIQYAKTTLFKDNYVCPDIDSDGDGVNNPKDNCLNTPNPDQADANSNGIGDACELTVQAYQKMEFVCYKADGYLDDITYNSSLEECKARCNKDEECEAYVYNSEANGFCTLRRNLCNCPDIKPNGNEGYIQYAKTNLFNNGFVCPDIDSDGDGVINSKDNCLDAYNPDQADADSNGIGDKCEISEPVQQVYKEMQLVCTDLTPSGGFISKTTQETQQLCENDCNNNSNCEAYTYNAQTGICILRNKLCNCPLTERSNFIQPGESGFRQYAKLEIFNIGKSADVVCDEFDLDQDGYRQDAGDCNDLNKDINPGAEEICGDGMDNNCDSQIDEDSICSSGSNNDQVNIDNKEELYKGINTYYKNEQLFVCSCELLENCSDDIEIEDATLNNSSICCVVDNPLDENNNLSNAINNCQIEKVKNSMKLFVDFGDRKQCIDEMVRVGNLKTEITNYYNGLADAALVNIAKEEQEVVDIQNIIKSEAEKIDNILKENREKYERYNLAFAQYCNVNKETLSTIGFVCIDNDLSKLDKAKIAKCYEDNIKKISNDYYESIQQYIDENLNNPNIKILQNDILPMIKANCNDLIDGLDNAVSIILDPKQIEQSSGNSNISNDLNNDIQIIDKSNINKLQTPDVIRNEELQELINGITN